MSTTALLEASSRTNRAISPFASRAHSKEHGSRRSTTQPRFLGRPLHLGQTPECNLLVGRNVRSFDFHLPQRFADGCVHKLRLRQHDGEFLTLVRAFVAFPDGLAQTLAKLGEYDSEQLRGKLYDKLVPASLPLDDYAQWLARFPPPTPDASPLDAAVVVVGTSGAEQTLATLESQSHLGWTAGVIDGPALEVDPDLLAEFLQQTASRADIVVIMMAGMRLNEAALAELRQLLMRIPVRKLFIATSIFSPMTGSSGQLAFPLSITNEC